MTHHRLTIKATSTNDEMCRRWITGLKTDWHLARCSLSISDGVLRSYGTPIASRWPDQKIVLITSRSYTPTTIKHRSCAHKYAGFAHYKVFYVPDLTPANNHRSNLDHFAERQAKMVEMMGGARFLKTFSHYRDHFECLRQITGDYCRAFDLAVPTIFTAPLGDLLSSKHPPKTVAKLVAWRLAA